MKNKDSEILKFVPKDFDESQAIVVERTCTLCHKTYRVMLDSSKHARWQAGSYVQTVWPELKPDQREIIINGTHPECFDKLFKSYDEEPVDDVDSDDI